jgi:exonuclease SbcD
MKILHTSDWHIGRTFHEYQTLEAARHVLGALPELIKKHGIDVVVASGDIYDTGSPNKDAVATLRDLFRDILETGARLVVISGNHDNSTKLGFAGAFSSGSGLHLLTEVESLMHPVEITDEHGPVDFYGIPFIEPSLHRHLEWMPSDAADQNRAVGAAMEQVRGAVAKRKSKGRRSVVLSHTFAAGSQTETSDSERPITKQPLVAGGVDNVPVDVFDGVDYVALGHIHGRLELKPHIRYSGAVLHYSFKEAGKPRGGWLVDLVPDKDAQIEWVDFPIYRHVVELRGTFNEIMTNEDHDKYKDYFVRVVYTDNVRQIDAMKKLQTRFPFCAEVVSEPANKAETNTSSYRDRVKGKTDLEIIEAFSKDVRNDQGLSKEEQKVLNEVLESLKLKEGSK